jgi:hypothetical protein
MAPHDNVLPGRRHDAGLPLVRNPHRDAQVQFGAGYSIEHSWHSDTQGGKDMNPMTEVIRYRKIKAQDDAAQETQRLIDGALHTLSLNSNVRVTHVVAKSIFLGSPWMWKGQSLTVNGKYVGCGVWELRREEAATHKEG